PQGVEQLDVMESHVLDGVDLVEAAALAEAGVCRHVDAEALRPRLVERQPAERLADRAVQVDERRSVAAVHQHRRPAVQVDALGLTALARQEYPRGVLQLLQRIEHARAPTESSMGKATG